jgi:hypothetical protein
LGIARLPDRDENAGVVTKARAIIHPGRFTSTRGKKMETTISTAAMSDEELLFLSPDRDEAGFVQSSR